MALAIGQAGARVILIARRPQPLSDTVNNLSSLAIEAHSYPTDLANRDDLFRTVADILGAHGVPDILVNAAGCNPRPHMDELHPLTWDEVLAINLSASFLLG